MQQARYSVSPSGILASLRLLESRGVDLRLLQERWGFPLATLDQPYLRLPAFLSRRFWEVAAELDSDPSLGLAAARPADLGQMLGVSYLMQLMPSRLQALETLQRYWPLVTAHIALPMERQGDQVRLGLVATAPILPTQLELDYWCARQIYHLRSWVCAPDPLLEVHFRRPPPADSGPWERLAGRPVYFAAERDELVLDYAALSHRRLAGIASVRQALEDALEDYARQTLDGNLLELVSSTVLQELHRGLSLETLAERLHMTPRTLHRALLRDGWKFSDLIDIHRRYLTRDLLQHSDASIAEIADALGYGEVNSLIRAIRRWYDSTPGALRETALELG
jgi:AraC-like DNA-binding protein